MEDLVWFWGFDFQARGRDGSAPIRSIYGNLFLCKMLPVSIPVEPRFLDLQPLGKHFHRVLVLHFGKVTCRIVCKPHGRLLEVEIVELVTQRLLEVADASVGVQPFPWVSASPAGARFENHDQRIEARQDLLDGTAGDVVFQWNLVGQ